MEQLIKKYHYYDSFGVWGSVIDNDKLNMAQLVQCTGARNCLEVGCFNGPILSILRDRGLMVTGIDLSHLAFVLAFENIRNNIIYGDLLKVRLDRKYECILLLDVVEHLSPLKFNRYLMKFADLLAPNGLIILNSPMFGHDPVFGTVFEQYLDQWREIGDRDFYKHWPCDEKGWPMHGHMIWASPAWWTRQFDDHGLIRQDEIERAIQRAFADYFLGAPARQSLVVFSHQHAGIDSQQICQIIRDQHWR
jgi:SAM-dependent methyltransferase